MSKSRRLRPSKPNTPVKGTIAGPKGVDSSEVAAGTQAVDEALQRKLVLALCCVAAIHVAIFSAAFPFFNNVDERAHLDLVVKYSRGHLPRGLEPISNETAEYIAGAATWEYYEAPGEFPGEVFST